MALQSLRGKSFADVVNEPVDVRMHMVVRAVRADDLPKLEWFGTMSHWRNVTRRTFSDHLAGQRLMFVVDINDFPVGQVVIDVTPRDYAYLYALRVMEPLRGLGIGTALLRTGDLVAREHGFRQIQLAVEKSNTAARRLYERFGYDIWTQRVDVWSYIDHLDQTHWVHEDVYGMRKWVS